MVEDFTGGPKRNRLIIERRDQRIKLGKQEANQKYGLTLNYYEEVEDFKRGVWRELKGASKKLINFRIGPK